MRTYLTPGLWIPAASKKHIPHQKTPPPCCSQRQCISGGKSCVVRSQRGIHQESDLRLVGDWPEPASTVIAPNISLALLRTLSLTK